MNMVDVARLPVPLQLVRQADLGPALPRRAARRTSPPSWPGSSATYGPDHIWFVDDIFGLKPGWVERFADLVEEQRRAGALQEPAARRPAPAKATRSTRCGGPARRRVWVGAESGSQKILDAMEKGTQVEQIYEAARRLHAAGIEVGFFLQFGYPGETREDIERTLQMVRDCRPGRYRHVGVVPAARHALLSPPCSTSWAASRTGRTPTTWPCCTTGPFTTAFYRWLHTVLHREFRDAKGLGRIAGRQASWYRPPRPDSPRGRLAYHCATLPIERAKLDRLRPQSSLHPRSCPWHRRERRRANIALGGPRNDPLTAILHAAGGCPRRVRQHRRRLRWPGR